MFFYQGHPSFFSILVLIIKCYPSYSPYFLYGDLSKISIHHFPLSFIRAEPSVKIHFQSLLPTDFKLYLSERSIKVSKLNSPTVSVPTISLVLAYPPAEFPMFAYIISKQYLDFNFCLGHLTSIIWHIAPYINYSISLIVADFNSSSLFQPSIPLFFISIFLSHFAFLRSFSISLHYLKKIFLILC